MFKPLPARRARTKSVRALQEVRRACVPAGSSVPSTRRATLRAPDRALAIPPISPDQTLATIAHRPTAIPPCRASCPLAKSLITLAAAPGSSFANASRIGPLSVSCIHSKSVPWTARRASVFLTTRRYTPALSRFFAQLRHLCNRKTPVFSRNGCYRISCNRVHLFDKCFLVFESQCHVLLLAYGYTIWVKKLFTPHIRGYPSPCRMDNQSLVNLTRVTPSA